MKKNIFKKSKLDLNKQTVTKLNKDQMNQIVGGYIAPSKEEIEAREKAKADSVA